MIWSTTGVLGLLETNDLSTDIKRRLGGEHHKKKRPSEWVERGLAPTGKAGMKSPGFRWFIGSLKKQFARQGGAGTGGRQGGWLSEMWSGTTAPIDPDQPDEDIK